MIQPTTQAADILRAHNGWLHVDAVQAAGKMVVDGRLDLHGHTQDEAFTALARFLETAQGPAQRTVIVITGKSGVLRQQVPRWLNATPNRARVLSFTAARPSDGGDGALYVLLRKAKQP